MIFFFFKQKTAYEMRISDWSSDVCSSDLSGAKAMFCDDTFPQHADAAQQASPALRITITIGTPRAGEHAYEDLVAEGSGGPVEAAEVAHPDPCWFFYTSGTTAPPTQPVLTHGPPAFGTNNHLPAPPPPTNN